MNLPPIADDSMVRLRQRPRRDGEASFFFHDPAFGRSAVKVLPGEFFVYNEDVVVTTTLGSCVAACIHDAAMGLGGMNHFMLPDANAGEASGRFGAFAMELLINELLKKGARRSALEAKIFGGGQVMKSLAGTQIGEKNVAFVQQFLQQEGIPVRGSDVLDIYPRKIIQFPKSGKVLCKRLPATHGVDVALQEEERYRAKLRKQPVQAGEVELF
jgi:chemotaxis protein CheD